MINANVMNQIKSERLEGEHVITLKGNDKRAISGYCIVQLRKVEDGKIYFYSSDLQIGGNQNHLIFTNKLIQENLDRVIDKLKSLGYVEVEENLR